MWFVNSHNDYLLNKIYKLLPIALQQLISSAIAILRLFVNEDFAEEEYSLTILSLLYLLEIHEYRLYIFKLEKND